MEKELAGEILEVAAKGVTVKIAANMQLIELETNGKKDEEIKETINKALKEVQKLAAKKMRGQLSDLGLNIPGL